MSSEIYILSLTAASIAFMHTLFGPDHYLPFVVLARARKWSKARTVWMTILCGIGHVGSSVLIGFIGISAGIALSKLNYFESVRANIAGWLFIGFGLLYALWGLRRAINDKPHTHAHYHLNGNKHVHEHTHSSGHTHVHEQDGGANSDKIEYKSLTPWVLFVIFVFGPCEPLIPLVMFPAMRHNLMGVVTVTTVFSLVTILTMLLAVLLLSSGLQLVKLEKLEKLSHALAGSAIFFSGVAIQFLGL